MTRALSLLAILTLVTWGAIESWAVDAPAPAFEVEIGQVQLADTEGLGGVIVDGADPEAVEMACSLCARTDGTTGEMCAICRLHDDDPARW